MRIGVFGGTFDPIHNGHLRLLQDAKRKLCLDRVLLVPAFVPPHKISQKNSISPAGLRLRMVRAAVKKRSYCRVVDWEIKKKRAVYTVETLRWLKRSYSRKDEFFLLTGADNYTIIKTWKYVPQILRLAVFVVARRPGYKSADLPAGFLALEMRPMKISASTIRSRIRSGQSVRNLLPRAVERIILDKGLYGTPRASSRSKKTRLRLLGYGEVRPTQKNRGATSRQSRRRISAKGRIRQNYGGHPRPRLGSSAQADKKRTMK